MRKFILATALATTLLPVAAMAQSYQDQRDRGHAQGPQGGRHDAHQAPHQVVADRGGDWRDYRRAHPDIYRGPRYAAPRAGWAYRPVAVGYRFDPVFYDRRYWIDPTRYRLPTVAGYQRWVRYGNDVVLVDIRSGRVMNVYGSFFY